MAMVCTVGRSVSSTAELEAVVVLALPDGSVKAPAATATETLPVALDAGVSTAVYTLPSVPAVSTGVLMLPFVTVMSPAPNDAPGASLKVKVSVAVCPNASVAGIPEMATVGAVRSTTNDDKFCVSSLPARSATTNVGV